MSAAPGTIIAGRYRVVRLVGRGGMGNVHEVLDAQTGRSRALKLMLDHRVEDERARARFEAEARLAGRIDSPYVVDVLDAGVDTPTGVPFIVMELLAGENLERRLARLGPRPPAEVVEHLAQVALALARMHARGVVHRDLKPSNLFLETPAGAVPRVKVLDLGIAKVLSETGGGATAVVGTVPYMAPEQVRGLATAAAIDRYALGMIAFTLLTGAPYWAGAADELPIALAMRIADGPRETASARAHDAGVTLPPTFDAWFIRATARDPEHRFADAVSMVRGLAAAFALAAPALLDDAPDVEPGGADAGTAATRETSTGRAPAPGLIARIRPGATESASVSTSAVGVREAAAPRLDTTRAAPRRRWWAPAGMSVAAAAAVAWAAWPARSSSAVPGALAGPDTVIACPVLHVDGDVTRWGWLGAAAAAVACERARVILGGQSLRTRVPAELLGLGAALPADDPYAQAGARDASIAAARRSDAYLDGDVTRLGADGSRYRVTLVLRRPDGTAIAEGAGESDALYAAVRSAMDPLVTRGALPMAAEPDPVVADYARARDVPTMLMLTDLKLAMLHNAGTLQAECARFEGADAATDLASFARWLCAFTLGEAAPPLVLPSGSSRGARVARARAQHIARRVDNPVQVAELIAYHAAETSPWARSVIATTLSCLLQNRDRGSALLWSREATRADPENSTGEWCGPWGQFMSIADDTVDKPKTAASWRLWMPWESYAWWYAARLSDDANRGLELARRAYALSPLDTNIAGALADRILVSGNAPAAGIDVAAIADRLTRSAVPVHRTFARLLALRWHVGRRELDEALRQAPDAGVPAGAGWSEELLVRLDWHVLEVAHLVETEAQRRARADAFADARVLAGEAAPGWTASDTAWYAIAICLAASPAKAEACIARLAALAPESALRQGAAHYVRGDLEAAAEAWRRLEQEHLDQLELVADAAAHAFLARDGRLPDGLVARIAKAAATVPGPARALARIVVAARARGATGVADAYARMLDAAWGRRVPSLRRLAPPSP